MKKTVTAIIVLSAFLASATAFARGGYYHYPRSSYHTSYYGGYHHPRPYYYNNHYRHSYYDSGDVIAGVAVGLLTGAIIGTAISAPPAPAYTTQYNYAPAPVVVQQPRICVEERVVSGEWQQDPNSGARFWATFPYPMKRTYQVPCY